MESLVYLLSHFSSEALSLELLFIGIVSVALFGMALHNRKKYATVKGEISLGSVKNYIENEMNNTQALRSSLFGENVEFEMTSTPGASSPSPTLQPSSAASPVLAAGGAASQDPKLTAELNSLRDQLNVQIQQVTNLNSSLESERKEKSLLRSEMEKLKAAGGAATGESSDNSDLLKKIKELEGRLKEYEIIEDDLADLKRLQQENMRLKASLDELKKTSGTPLDEAEEVKEAQEADEGFEEVVDEVEKKLDANKGVSVVEPEALVEESEDSGGEPQLGMMKESLGEEIEMPEPVEGEAPSIEAVAAPEPEIEEVAVEEEEPVVAAEPVAAASEAPAKNLEENDLLKEFEAMLES